MMKMKRTLLAILVMVLLIGIGFAPATSVQAATSKVGVPTLKVKNTDVGADLKVTWKKVSGASGYVVYMSTTKSKGYSKVATTTKASYTTSKVKKNKTYYFKVKAYKTVDGKKVYSSYSKAVSGKTSKYLLNTVIDEGGQEVYFYWLWDGKSAARDENFWKAFHECEDILLERYNGKTKKPVGSSKNVDDIVYSLNGKTLCISTPHVDFD